MKIPYHCPYCDQVSMRKWNLSTHMRRKHKELDNPFDMAKETVLTDSVYQSRNNNKYESFWPQFNPSNPFEPIEKLGKFKNLKEELKQCSKNELHLLIFEIFNILESKWFLVYIWLEIRSRASLLVHLFINEWNSVKHTIFGFYSLWDGHIGAIKFII